MRTTTVKPREASIVSDRHLRNIMGFPVWEALPARDVPYELSDPFLLVHEATLKISPAMANLDTEHPHRGFDNLCGTYSRVQPARATRPVPAGGSNEHACPRARSCIFGLDGAYGTRKASARTSSERVWKAARSGASCSGSTSPAGTSKLNRRRESCRLTIWPGTRKETPPPAF